MASRVQHVLVLLLVVAFVPSVRCQDTCGELGNGDGSECTEGFASPYHIDILVGNTNLVTASGQQVLIPDINFPCNGNITKWIVGADWNRRSNAQSTTYTELQVWRESSASSSFNNTYTKVGSTIIVIDREDSSGLYEYPLETPLAFQEGDVLGYYQPSNKQNIDLYLEEPNSLVAFFCGADRISSVDTSSSKCNINNNQYPLIKVETNPPNSGRGFMSLERMITLLTLTLTTRNVMGFSGQQLIFPSVQFNCSGEVLKWIMVGTEWFGDSKPELQIWTPLQNNVFTKTSGAIISSAVMIRSRVYEYKVESPLPFQPGDILGVFQPLFTDSQLQVDYDSDDDSLYYFISTGADAYPQNTTFNTTDGALTLNGLPLVSVEITTSSVATSSAKAGNIVQLATTSKLPTKSLSPAATSSVATSSAKANFEFIVAISIPIGVTVTVILLSICLSLVWLRHRRQMQGVNTHQNPVYISQTQSLEVLVENTAYCSTDTVQSHYSEPYYSYVEPISCGKVDHDDIKMATNVAYNSRQNSNSESAVTSSSAVGSNSYTSYL